MRSLSPRVSVLMAMLVMCVSSPHSIGKIKKAAAATDFSALDCSDGFVHERLQGVLWMQRSGEFRANLRQAYNSARYNLDIALQAPDRWRDAVVSSSGAKPKEFALIVDIDETVLDNTPEELQLMAKD